MCIKKIVLFVEGEASDVISSLDQRFQKEHTSNGNFSRRYPILPPHTKNNVATIFINALYHSSQNILGMHCLSLCVLSWIFLHIYSGAYLVRKKAIRARRGANIWSFRF